MPSTGKKRSLDLPLISFLSALSVAISLIEDFFFPAVPLPGVSFGLNNAVFLVFINKLRLEELFFAQLLKVFISSILYKGLNVNSLFLSLSGALSAFLVLALYKNYLQGRGFSLITASVASASVHLTAQIYAASIILKNQAPFAYLPFSGMASVVLGFFVGLIANAIKSRIR